MKALVYHGLNDIRLEEKPMPVVLAPTDAIVKVTCAAICTSDLHICHGAVPRAVSGVALGHEFTGEIIALGNEVKKLALHDRVTANCITFCGECWFCKRGYINNCENGGWELGCTIDGGHAEYVRVPLADQGLNKIPASLTDEQALFVGDILASGFFGAELAEIRPGDSVAVIGAGPVGLCAMQCARLFGAGSIIVIDQDETRLRFAEENLLADVCINTAQQNVEQRIKEHTCGRGADAVIECAGGRNTFQLAWQVARPNAVVAVVAMYEEDQTLPLPEMYGKNLVFKTGGVDARDSDRLLGLIESGKLDTNLLITHRSPLRDIRAAYEGFENKKDFCLKWIITP